MAKFHVTWKSPDGPYECLAEARRTIPAGDVERLADKFCIGEYLTVEFDTETGTATIVPEGWRKVLDDAHYEQLNEEWRAERAEEEFQVSNHLSNCVSEDRLKEAEADLSKRMSQPTTVEGGFETMSDLEVSMYGISAEKVERIKIR